jgi:ubiquinol-cytochrome c reductase cytochrome b subunit
LNRFVLLGLGMFVLLGLSTLEAREPAGADLAQRLGCLGCHALDGKGGRRGPAWDGVGKRLTPDAIEKQIVAPQGNMPNYAHLKPGELKALVGYLAGLN